MPLRSVKMKRFILGFQRRVWCPKWTPLSSSWRMVTAAMVVSPGFLVDAPPVGDAVVLVRTGHHPCRGGPGPCLCSVTTRHTGDEHAKFASEDAMRKVYGTLPSVVKCTVAR